MSTSKEILYKNILSLVRDRLFYTNFNLIDTFQNRIILIFLHISFIFIKIKQSNEKDVYKRFYQEMFDLIFYKIDLNMREIGFGDTVINKNMKFLVKTFYSILFVCEKYNQMQKNDKNDFFIKYISLNKSKKIPDNPGLIRYFDKYAAFCFDLSHDSVLKGELNFNYNNIEK